MIIDRTNVVIVNTCDAWQGYESFKLVGVYTSKSQLKALILRLLESDTIELDDGGSGELSKEDLDFDDIEAIVNQLKYININIITVNEDQ